MRDAPHQPREEALQPEAAHLDDGALAPDGGERTVVPIAERRERLALLPREQQLRHIDALLLRDRRDAGQRIAVCIVERGGVADDEDIAEPRHRKVRCDLHAARAIGLGAEPLARRRGHHAGRPHHRARLDACRFRSLADRHAGVVERRDRRAERTSTPSCSSEVRAASESGGSNGVSRRGAASTRMMRAARGSMERKSLASARFASSAIAPAISTPVGPPPTITKFKQPRPLGRIGFGLGLLEGEQDAAANVGRVVDGLQPRSAGGPFVVTEIGVLRAGRENQDVVGNAPAVGEHLAPLGVDSRDLAKDHVDVLLARQNAADRRGDVGGRKPRGRDLIEQRLEQVIVVLVDDGDVEWLSGQHFRGGEPAEAGSDDDDAGVGHGDLA